MEKYNQFYVTVAWAPNETSKKLREGKALEKGREAALKKAFSKMPRGYVVKRCEVVKCAKTDLGFEFSGESLRNPEVLDFNQYEQYLPEWSKK